MNNFLTFLLLFFISNAFTQSTINIKDTSFVYYIVEKIDTTLYNYDLDSAGNRVFYKDSIGKKFYTQEGVQSKFKGGRESWIKYLIKNLNLSGLSRNLSPNDYVNNIFRQIATVQFIVCTDGSVCDIEVINSVVEYAKDEAIRVIKKSPKWFPALQNGKPVKSRVSHNIGFQVIVD